MTKNSEQTKNSEWCFLKLIKGLYKEFWPSWFKLVSVEFSYLQPK